MGQEPQLLVCGWFNGRITSYLRSDLKVFFFGHRETLLPRTHSPLTLKLHRTLWITRGVIYACGDSPTS